MILLPEQIFYFYSLDNVVEGKRRSRMSTPQKSTPSRRRTSKSVTSSSSTSKSRSKPGGDFAETSVFEADTSAAESALEVEDTGRGKFSDVPS